MADRANLKIDRKALLQIPRQHLPKQHPKVRIHNWNDPETFETTRPGVFAGGDCVNGADLIVTALADGRRAAGAIHTHLINEVEVAA